MSLTVPDADMEYIDRFHHCQTSYVIILITWTSHVTAPLGRFLNTVEFISASAETNQVSKSHAVLSRSGART